MLDIAVISYSFFCSFDNFLESTYVKQEKAYGNVCSFFHSTERTKENKLPPHAKTHKSNNTRRDKQMNLPISVYHELRKG